MAYTNIDDPSVYFQSHTFTKSAGTGSTTFTGNSDLQPDFLWTKSRTNADSHELWDSTRGVNSTLFSDSTSAEDTSANRITSFNTDGYSWGNAGNHNAAGSVAAWAWKANGGTTSSNTDGTLTSTVQANTDAGFSIVTFTSPSSGSFSMGHGLGVKPALVITKSLNGSSNWWTWHKGLGSDTTHYLDLSATSAQGNVSNMWGSTGITSSVFGMNYPASAYANRNYVAYCFAEKQGFNKFGTYRGNGSLDGPFIFTGFKPAFVIVKQRNTARPWQVVDNKRDGYNELNMPYLQPNDSAAETSGAGVRIDLVSNGFKVRSNQTGANQSGGTYIYIAFAENPFVTSTGIPATAR